MTGHIVFERSHVVAIRRPPLGRLAPPRGLIRAAIPALALELVAIGIVLAVADAVPLRPLNAWRRGDAIGSRSL